MKILKWLFILLLLQTTPNARSQFLKRSLSGAAESECGLSTATAHYKALFGEGDTGSSIIKGLTRYGNLTVDPSGSSKFVRYKGEELVIYVLDGTGILECEKDRVPIGRDDFLYIPSGERFRFANPREIKLSVLIMSFGLVPGDTIGASSKMMIAAGNGVPFQVLGYHGPTTTFQLLMGTTGSKRDRLAAASRVTSLFVMDFAAGGTNIPHRHDDEEEIYLILRGKGDIVAGESPDGKESRHPSAAGDAYFFAPKTLIGFYSGNGECEEHARILAVRFRYPSRQLP